MHPYLRVLILAAVAVIVAGALVALALTGRNTTLSLIALLVAGAIATLTGGFVFVMSWVWSQRVWNEGRGGQSLAIAMAGGMAIVVAAAALAGSVILLLTFTVS
jgi:hypothetical protein